jgi:hypothetical protein
MDSHQEANLDVKLFPLKWVLVWSVITAAFMIFADYYAVSPKGSVEILTLRDFLLFPICAAIPGIFISIIYCVRKNTRQKASKWLLSCFVFVAVIIAAARIGQRLRMNAFASLAERSEPLMAAIKDYEHAHGKPPASLDVLIPEYLAAIPHTGMGAYPEYQYRVVTDRGREYGNPWVIVVFIPTGVPDFDEFFYYPLQNYPSHRWGANPVERVRDWAYMHE